MKKKIIDYTLTGSTIIISALISYLYADVILYAKINRDAGFYLSYCQRILEGIIPYSDISLGTTPLCYYLITAPLMLFNIEANYYIYISVFLAAQFFSAVFIYLILTKNNTKKNISLLLSLIFLLIMYRLDGIYIVLEPFVVLFSCLTLYLYCFRGEKNYTLFLCGITCSLAFLSKQYGLAVLGSLLMTEAYKAYNKRSTYRDFVCILLGFVAPIATGLIFFILQGAESKNLIMLLTGNGYGYRSLSGMAQGLFLFMVKEFLIIIPLLILTKRSKIIKNPIVLMSVFMFFLFCFSLYFKTLSHYYMFLIAPGIIVIGLSIPHIRSHKFYYLIQILIITLSIVSITRASLYKNVRMNKKYRVKQLFIAKTINQTIPEKSRVFNCADPTLDYLCNFYPPSFKNCGYAFLENFNNRQLRLILQESEFAITQNSYLKRKFGPEKDIIRLLTEENFSKEKTLFKRITLWKKN